MKKAARILLFALIIGLSLSLAGVAKAQDRSWNWTSWNTRIDNIDTKNNVFHVTETQKIEITSGSFAGGDRSVDLDRLTSVDNITVNDGGTSLQRRDASSADDCPTDPGIFCVFPAYGGSDIYYNFTQEANDGDVKSIVIGYDIHGGLRSYPDGDQLWWRPLATNRDFPVLASTTTVVMPTDRPSTVFTGYGHPMTASNSANTVTFITSGTVDTSETGVEIRVQYAHDPAMVAPPWQAGFDRQQALEPILSLLMVVLAALFGLGGPILIYIRYATHGRDAQAVVVPEYLSEPPSNVPPGVIGTLVDEQADMADIMATLVDLARRGYLVIEQEQHSGLLSSSMEFVFHRTDQSTEKLPTATNFSSLQAAMAEATAMGQMLQPGVEQDTQLRNYERVLLDSIFRGGSTTRLSDLRNRFYTTVPVLKSSLYNEVVRAGYFTRSPEAVRQAWMIGGVALIVIGGGGAFFLLQGDNSVPSIPLLPLPFLGLALAGIAAAIASSFMPSKTPLGAQEAAKWKAFRNYLKNITKYTDVKEAGDQFDKYIGYAVAFGLDSAWIHTFAHVLTSMPTWYYPTYLGGPWGGGYYGNRGMMGGSGGLRGGMGITGGLNQPSMGSGLNSMSDNLGQGLNAMSSGLTSMLNSASSVMNSKPSSSGSGGGGFSGGGGHGGGGSGGGHAGGH